MGEYLLRKYETPAEVQNSLYETEAVRLDMVDLDTFSYVLQTWNVFAVEFINEN